MKSSIMHNDFAQIRRAMRSMLASVQSAVWPQPYA